MEFSKKTSVIILIIIIFLQVLFRIYIGTKKEYFHMDEAYSYGLMNYDKLSVVDNKDFFNTWHNKQYYLDYLEINKEESDNFNAVFENQKNDVHPPLYYLLLRTSAEFTIDNFSKWTGIILNILFFIISSIVVYLLSNLIFKNRTYALITTLVNGFTLMSLESTIYIRMYELANLMIIMSVYFSLKMINKDKINILSLLPLCIMLILGGLTHYYFFIFALGLYIAISYKLFKSKKYKEWGKYTGALVISGIIYILLWPYAINHIFFGYRGMNTNVGGLSGFYNNLGLYLMVIINKGIFHYSILLAIFALWIICQKGKKRDIEDNNLINLLIIPVLIYILLVSSNSPYIETRYIIPVYSIFTIIYVYFVKRIISKYYDNKKTVYISVALLFAITISPLFNGTKLEMTYSQFNHIATRVEKSNMPIIYIFSTENERFLDDIYLFTLVENSIVLDDKTNYKSILENQKEDFILVCNEGVDEDLVKSNLQDKDIQYAQRMNACNVYFILNK